MHNATPPWSVFFYQDDHGRRPVEEWVSRFYLLHAFSKKTAKTPDRELAIAERRLGELEARLKGEDK
jgi:phage-related protein